MNPGSMIGAAGVLAVVLGGVLVVTPADERAAVAAGAAFMVGIWAALLVPSVRRTALRHPRVCAAAGVGLIALGTATAFAGPGGAWTGFAAFLVLTGLFLALFPRSARGLEDSLVAMEADAARPPPGRFDPVAEVRSVLADMTGERLVVLRVAGPWLLAFCILPFAFADLDVWKGLASRGPGWALSVSLSVLGVILAEFALLSMALIQWARFTATRQAPRLTDVALKPLAGWLWRLLVFGNVFSWISVGPWLSKQLPQAAPWLLDGLDRLIGFAVLVLISPAGLYLCAIALGAPRDARPASLRGFRAVGRGFYLGVALILAPCCVAWWLLALLAEQQPRAALAVFAVAVLALISTLLAATGYLTRIYLRGTPRAG